MKRSRARYPNERTRLRSKQCAGIALRSVPIVNSGAFVGCRLPRATSSCASSAKNEALFVMAALTWERVVSSSRAAACARIRSDLLRGWMLMSNVRSERIGAKNCGASSLASRLWTPTWPRPEFKLSDEFSLQALDLKVFPLIFHHMRTSSRPTKATRHDCQRTEFQWYNQTEKVPGAAVRRRVLRRRVYCAYAIWRSSNRR